MANVLKAQRTVAKQKFTRTEKSLDTAITTDGTPLQTIVRKFGDFKKVFEDAENAHDAYVASLGEMTAETAETEEAWINDICQRYDNLEVKCDTKTKELEDAEKPAVAPPAAPPATAAGVPVNKDVATVSNLFKPERMKFPIYDGSIRKYARWKEDFELHIKPNCTEAQLSFVLKSYLCEELREEMNCVGESVEDIWDRLDKRFGNQSRLVDTILADVKSIAHCKEDDELTLQMIKVVERCYSELKSMKRESELNNTTIISMIEEKMPSEMSNEWIKLMTKDGIKHEEKFTHLKKLLEEWRCRIEYKIANVRSTPSPATPITGNVNFGQGAHQRFPTNKKSSCWLHKTAGAGDHPIWRCRLFQSKPVEERIELVSSNNACFVCLETDHITANCPKKFTCTVDNCNQRHNKLLHLQKDNPSNNTGGGTLLPTQ